MLAKLRLLNDPVFRDPGSFTPVILDQDRLLCLTNNLDSSSHRWSRGPVYFLLTFGMIGTGTEALLRFPGEFIFPILFLNLDLPGMLAELLLCNDPDFRDPSGFIPVILDPERFLGLNDYLNRDSHRRIRQDLRGIATGPLMGIATGPLADIATGQLAGFSLPRGFT